jgi:hypothetical protein
VQLLKDTIQNFDKDRGAIQKAAEGRLEKARTHLEAAKLVHDEAEQDVSTRMAEHETAAAEREELSKQVKTAESARDTAKVRTCAPLPNLSCSSWCAVRGI